MGSDSLRLQGLSPHLFPGVSERQRADLAGNSFSTCVFAAVLSAVLGQCSLSEAESESCPCSPTVVEDASEEESGGMLKHFLNLCK